MSEKTLLVEIEKDQQKEIERKLQSIKQKAKEKEVESEEIKPYKNMFSSSSFPAEEIEKLREKYAQKEEPQVEEQEQINKIESKVAQVVETPNYDLMESLSEDQKKKVFVFKKEKPLPEVKPKNKKFRVVFMSILFALFGVWGVVNIASINSVSTEYSLNLANYIKNLYTLDATNSENMANLFEVIPDEEYPPTQIEKESNWFDRICNFLGGLFGG